MTFPAIAFDAVSGAPSYSAGQWRLAMSGLFTPSGALGVRSGALNAESFTPSVSGGTLTVAPGRAVVQGATTTTQGAYLTAMPTSWAASIPAANASNPRVDLVYLRIWDTEVDASGSTQADLVYLAGTPAASPVLPTIPSGQTGLPLVSVSVPKSGGGSPVATTTGVMPLTAARGGAVLTQSSADESAMTEPGQLSIRSDLPSDRVRWYDGTTWRSVTERHYVTVARAASFGLPASVYTMINWDTLVKTSPGDTMWTTGAPGSLIAPVSGEYDISALTLLPAGATSSFHIRAYVNGVSAANLGFTPSVSAGAFWGGWAPLELSAGDVVSIYMLSGVLLSTWAPGGTKDVTVKLIWNGP